MSDQPHRSSSKSPFLVAVAAWLVPGAGYFLLGQWARGLTIGITILLLYFSGLLVGGIRCIEVPGYNAHGDKTYSWVEINLKDRTQTAHFSNQLPHQSSKVAIVTSEETAVPPQTDTVIADLGWTLLKHPVVEVRSKPWTIPQIMAGPVDLLCDWWSVTVSQRKDPGNPHSERIAPRSHSRVNEYGVLYTAVAGMLNLLAIIDSSHRAMRTEGQ